MQQDSFAGLGVALVTPFLSDDSVDESALLRLLDFHIQNKTDYLVILGTTAETPALTLEEQHRIKNLIVNHIAGSLPIVMGLGGNNTQAVVQRLQTEDLTGVDAILSVVPYYNKPNQEGIFQHYKQIAQASPCPVILYNVPGRTGVNMTAATTLRLATEVENIIAVKEASGNMEQAQEILDRKPDHFQVICGDDALAYSMIDRGAIGVISVLANAFPLKFGAMVHRCMLGDADAVQSIHQRFADLYQLLFAEGSPAGIKCVMQLLDKIENKLRLPLTPVSSELSEKLRSAILKLNAI
ncbi:MAG: 4-hydroxy-tetrahydrodipicolinate synthase [Candidatus Symbiothrix sp.]|jgi:4-hydroxy-tetrahydrodipicolinate synthase|nr:4-hydroxy-tetrahydrodipicolinate synthase [Candidatus Symbiothrix sp.]